MDTVRQSGFPRKLSRSQEGDSTSWVDHRGDGQMTLGDTQLPIGSSRLATHVSITSLPIGNMEYIEQERLQLAGTYTGTKVNASYVWNTVTFQHSDEFWVGRDIVSPPLSHKC